MDLALLLLSLVLTPTVVKRVKWGGVVKKKSRVSLPPLHRPPGHELWRLCAVLPTPSRAAWQ